MASDPLTALRTEIENIAGDGGLDPTDKGLKLQHYADELTDLQGLVTTYLADAQLGQEAGASVAAQVKLRARQNATIREHLVGRSLATPEQMDAMGYLSHSDLDKLSEEGLLEAMLEELAGHLTAVDIQPRNADELVAALDGPDWLEAISGLVESGYELEGEPAAGEALVLQRTEEGQADRIVVTFAEGGDALTVEAVERN